MGTGDEWGTFLTFHSSRIKPIFLKKISQVPPHTLPVPAYFIYSLWSTTSTEDVYLTPLYCFCLDVNYHAKTELWVLPFPPNPKSASA